MFNWGDHAPPDPEAVLWDVVVVGAGMGGSFLGWGLARQGLKVLFLERGVPVDPLSPRPRSGRLSRLLRPDGGAAELAARGRWSRRVPVVQDGRRAQLFLPIGNGPGGSSALYGAVLERFRREDFAGPDAADPTALPGVWPIPYDDFLPYYRQAETLLGVRGTRDPTDPDDDSQLGPPAPLSDGDRDFFEAFQEAGMGPHRMHVGIDYKPGCSECIGELCPRDCKAEGASRALKPALTHYAAKLLTGVTVERLEVEGAKVKAVHGRLDGRPILIRGKLVVLAAGALSTPLILLNSKSEAWPDGVGNGQGLVGRGLMFHMLQVFAMWPSRKLPSEGFARGLSCRAYNEKDGRKFGGIQTFAKGVSAGQIAQFLTELGERHLTFASPLINLAALAVAFVAARVFSDAEMFAALTEDFAHRENGVALDPASPSGFSISYTSSEELTRRVASFRQIIKSRLRSRRPTFLSSTRLPNFGHPSGTCRFGDDPRTSVLTPDNQVRGVEGLYVVDASFFPSSAATNPSLTIVANALRVTEVIARSLAGERAVVASSPAGR